MKTLFILLLLIGTLQSQTVIVDSLNLLRTDIGAVDSRTDDLENGVWTITGDHETRITTLENTVDQLSVVVYDLLDSIAAHRTVLDYLLTGVVVPDPLPPINVLATADGDTAQIILTWDDPASGATPDSYILYQSTNNITYDSIGSVAYGINIDTITGLAEATTYYYKLKSRADGPPIVLSSFSASSNATTFTSAGGGGSGGWTYDYLISPMAIPGGDSITLAQALTVQASGDTFYVAPGVYTLTGAITFNANNTVWRGELAVADEKTRNCYGTNSSVILDSLPADGDGRVRVTANNVEFRQIVFKKATDGPMIVINGTDFTMDSCATKFPYENGTLSWGHFITGYGESFTITNSWLFDAGVSGIWLRGGQSTAPHNSVIERCWFSDFNRKNAIQIMPSTNLTAPVSIRNCVVRYNTFENNSFSDGFVARKNTNLQVYANLFDNCGSISMGDVHPVINGSTYDTTQVGYFVYNTVIQSASSYAIVNQALEYLTVQNNVFYNSSNWNLGKAYGMYCASWGSPLIYPPNLGHTINYNMYYSASNPEGTGWLGRQANASCTSLDYSFSEWQNLLHYDDNSLNNTEPEWVDFGSDDFNVTTSNMSGSQSGLPSSITSAYTMDGQVRESNSIGMNNKK